MKTLRWDFNVREIYFHRLTDDDDVLPAVKLAAQLGIKNKNKVGDFQVRPSGYSAGEEGNLKRKDFYEQSEKSSSAETRVVGKSKAPLPLIVPSEHKNDSSTARLTSFNHSSENSAFTRRLTSACISRQFPF